VKESPLLFSPTSIPIESVRTPIQVELCGAHFPKEMRESVKITGVGELKSTLNQTRAQNRRFEGV
jgi:hypothetical protein